jgi:hypothetical protein
VSEFAWTLVVTGAVGFVASFSGSVLGSGPASWWASKWASWKGTHQAEQEEREGRGPDDTRPSR